MSLKNYIPISIKNFIKGFLSKSEPVPPKVPVIEDFESRKIAKCQKIQSILQCPECGSDDISSPSSSNNDAHCKKCHRQYSSSKKNTFNFLSDEIMTIGGVFETENVSFHTYGKVCMDLVNSLKGKGLVLDAGAGFNGQYHNDVVNLEIADYATTDVLGICERLPFKDNSFGGIISVAVLEHLKDPFKAAEELLRVLKPGGFLFVDVPFLQPFHGYPSHYYNMTSEGVKNLFGDRIEIENMSFHNPFDLFPWFFKELLAGIPQEYHNKIKRLRVSDLLDSSKTMKYSKMMSKESRETLAHTTTIIAKKNN